MLAKKSIVQISNVFLAYEGWLIFCACFIIYVLNKRTISAGDTIPNTLLAFNWLINHTLDFENFRNTYQFFRANHYFFAETSRGSLIAAYPIGAAIVTFPIYIGFYFYLLISKGLQTIDITSAAFEVDRLFFEKIAAVVVASLSVVIFYSASKLKFGKSIAIISTFIYAFATGTWTISSQGLWQHGPTNLVTLAALLCLLKAHRSEKQQKTFLLLAGIFCGLLPGIRPTNSIFLLAILLHAIFTYRKQSLPFFFGLSSACLSVSWNLYHFGTLSGGYGGVSSLYIITFKQFFQGFFALLVSPSRGLLVFSPIVLYAVPGFWQALKLKSSRDEKLIFCFSLAAITLFIQYCFFEIWWAGYSYGPRFLIDVLPIACFLINYAIVTHLRPIHQTKRKLLNTNTVIFFLVLLFSLFVQVVGAFGTAMWEAIPLRIDRIYDQSHSTWRLWALRDSQIERHAQTLFFKIAKPAQNLDYIQGLRGSVLQVRNEQRQPITTSMRVAPGTTIVMKAKVKNTGESRWLGYETGAGAGEVLVRVHFLDQQYQLVHTSWLYISGRPQSQQTANALGEVTFPLRSGDYRMMVDLVIAGTGEMGDVKGRSTVEIPVEVSISNSTTSR
jgi:Dolichyl-phosphate-mannose-protein mannosyltransferase